MVLVSSPVNQERRLMRGRRARKAGGKSMLVILCPFNVPYDPEERGGKEIRLSKDGLQWKRKHFAVLSDKSQPQCSRNEDGTVLRWSRWLFAVAHSHYGSLVTGNVWEDKLLLIFCSSF